MTLEVRLGQEPLSAHGADVGTPRPVSRMRLLVRLQGSPLREPLPAQFAHVRLFPGVNADVLDQLVLLGEALGAHVAGVRFVPRVGPEVELELLPAGQSLAADVAEHRQVDLVVLVFLDGVSPQAASRFVVFLAYGAVEFDEWFAR